MKILQQPSFYVDRARRFQVGEKMGGYERSEIIQYLRYEQ